jgi:hypothetical protein
MSSHVTRPVPDSGLARLAWVVWTLIVLLWAAMLALIVQPRPVPSAASFALQRASSSTFILSAVTVGALVAWRRPRNPIGWLLCLAAFSWTGIVFSAEYELYAVVEAPGALPAGQLGQLFIHAFFIPGLAALTFTMLLFPNGHFLGPRWALVGWGAIVGGVVSHVSAALTPGPVQTAMFSLARNPYGTVALPAIFTHGTAGQIVSTLCFLVAAVSLLVRFRDARGVERQQLKWLALGAACVPIFAIPWSFKYAANVRIAQEVLPALPLFAAALVPVAIGIALLRYRLYDVDVIINRTLVYGVVTAVLAGAFAALSVLTQRLTLAVTGHQSEAAVVLAALVVTALFQPVRSRVQRLVDRRFYRTRYDAGRTLERFASQVRDEVELDRLTHTLVMAVHEAMQPAHASLWLRPRLSQPKVDVHQREPN